MFGNEMKIVNMFCTIYIYVNHSILYSVSIDRQKIHGKKLDGFTLYALIPRSRYTGMPSALRTITSWVREVKKGTMKQMGQISRNKEIYKEVKREKGKEIERNYLREKLSLECSTYATLVLKVSSESADHVWLGECVCGGAGAREGGVDSTECKSRKKRKREYNPYC